MGIVCFSSRATGPFIMFKETAKEIFRLIDEPWLEEGAFSAEQLPEILTKLQELERKDKERYQAAKQAREEKIRSCSFHEQCLREEKGIDKEFDSQINLYQRIVPLIQMIERSIQKDVPVQWGKP